MGRLDGKVGVVTGGGNGIGRACALRFAEEGADIVVADLLDGPGKDSVAAIEALGRRAVFVPADTASPDDNETMMQRAIDEFGRLDVVVTAAGVSNANYRSGADLSPTIAALSGASEPPSQAASFLDQSLHDWNRVLEVNLTGTLLSIQSAARRMTAHGTPGSIITLASIMAKVPTPGGGKPSYNVSKAGVWMLTKMASASLAPLGIRVNAIGPGYIETYMTAIVRALPEMEERSLRDVPMGRMGTPREIADTALFLASDESSYTTGEIFHVDGGYYTE